MTQNTTKNCFISKNTCSLLFGLKNAQGTNFQSHEIDLEYNVTSC